MRRFVPGPADWWAGWFGGSSGSAGVDEQASAPRRAFFRSGEVRLALLSLLADGRAHGYDLMKRLEERSGRLYHASAGTVYPVLQQLEDEALVSVETAGGKKVYALTGAGRQWLGDNRQQIDAIWQRAERWHEMGSHLTPDTIAVAVAVGQLATAALRAAKAQPELAERIRAILAHATDEVRASPGHTEGGKEKES
jgi:DNA-binding PadR family transcriptional regulator